MKAVAFAKHLGLGLALAAAAIGFASSAVAQAQPRVGVVLMHGKGGSPKGHLWNLASSLEQKGHLVASLEMPWSGKRGYDADVEAAEKQVQAALESMRARGAGKVFVAGHSQGGLFAIHYAGRHPVDGVIAIAPGGSVASPIFRREVGESVAKARQRIAEGKGGERTDFKDYEGSKGAFSIRTSAAAYLSWFDPEGAMNQERASRAVPERVPVLYIAPKRDYPGLLSAKGMMFGALPKNPLTRMVEPDSGHLDAPDASRDEIARWITEVALARG